MRQDQRDDAVFNRHRSLRPAVMKSRNLLLWLLIGFVLAPLSASATCRLPIPDGGDETYIPSRANVFGNIQRVELPYVFVIDGQTHHLEKISISKITEIYSVYGGDGPLSELKPKLQVWVWFANCKRPKEGFPNAAYFQIFSTDPTDRARLDREGRIVSVPPR